jgi:predicted metal-dependent hydrolase
MKTSSLELRSICESWQINHAHVKQQRTTIKLLEPYTLLVKGYSSKHRKALQRWLKQKAYRHLGNWMQALSEDFELDFQKITVRGQRTRWGSCSEDKSINLNYKLLFLPANLVEYVLLHELCHTKFLDHSSRFWKLVESFDSNYKQHQKLLLKANQYLPRGFH